MPILRAILLTLAVGAILLVAGILTSWPTALFCAGVGAAIFLAFYDLFTPGSMKQAILLTPLTLLVAAAVAKFMGI